MDETSEIPGSAKPIIQKIDTALTHLAKDDLLYFQDCEKKRRQQVTSQKVKSVGLESEFHNAIYDVLKREFGDNLINKPGFKGKRSNDLGIKSSENPIYVELGNGYWGGKYKEDCDKLMERLHDEPRAIGVIIHLHHNPIERPLHADFRKLLGDDESYWKSLCIFPDDKSPRHFVRLAFGRKRYCSQPIAEDFLPIKGYDHVEFYVGNARQAAHFYDKTFGFRPVGKSGLETGCRDRSCYLMEQGNVRFLFSSAYGPDHEISRHCALHGDGVKAIGLGVANVESALAETKKRGATVLQPATSVSDDNGTFVTGTIKYAGDTVFRFVDRTRYKGSFPGFKPIEAQGAPPVGLAAIDHIVTNVHLGEMNYWATWFEKVMGFSNLLAFTDKDISTEYSALMSKVMENGTGKCKFPINEPAEGKKKSQIDEYLDYYYGPGVQHIAMNTANIYETVRELRYRDIDFLRVPDTYYDYMRERVGDVGEDWNKLRELGILLDKDDDGYLLQIFTQPVQDRPTLFFEVIERHGSRGFGIGNFKALFVSIEREQALRGNL